jgi:NADPH:quinone reductase-like Zn-dependent oxidoreductase
MMQAVIVTEVGKTPLYAQFEEPVPEANEVLVTVSAAALSPIAKGRALGKHYSDSAHFPLVVGIDGVGCLEDGRRVYFALPRAPFGSLSERSVVPLAHCVMLPEGLDDLTAAAIANPGMSAWAALKERAQMMAGETVLVNGATGSAGTLAVQIARYMGAKKVIATGRNVEALAALNADVTIPLGATDDTFEQALQEQFRAGIDVVVDYLWGASAERIIIAAAKAAPEARPIRFVHVGSMSAQDITLPSAALRATGIQLMGSGMGSISLDRFIQSVADLMQVAVVAGFTIPTRTVPIAEIASVWDAPTSPRVVFQIS